MDRLKGKIEEVRKQVNVRPNNGTEGGRSGNVRVRRGNGTGKQGK